MGKTHEALKSLQETRQGKYSQALQKAALDKVAAPEPVAPAPAAVVVPAQAQPVRRWRIGFFISLAVMVLSVGVAIGVLSSARQAPVSHPVRQVESASSGVKKTVGQKTPKTSAAGVARSTRKAR
jgi:hypothetical protein